MVALTFYPYRKIVKKPKRYTDTPQTLGEHIRKKRIEQGLYQKDIAVLFNVSEDTITYWENGRSQPQVKHYPAIIQYLDYYPFAHETETLAGKLKHIRYVNGYCFERFAEVFKVSIDAAKRWEQGKPLRDSKLKTLIQLVWEELPNVNEPISVKKQL